jgi:hypothetical protein
VSRHEIVGIRTGRWRRASGSTEGVGARGARVTCAGAARRLPLIPPETVFVKRLFAACLLVVFAAPGALRAQVGYPPAQSPYRDLEFRQELTPYAGWFAASKDPAGVAPQSGPLIGLRYEARVGGPAQLSVRAARIFSERTVVDPTKPVGTRRSAAESWPLYTADVNLTINLTGQKSIRHLVPVVSGGIGIASDFKGDEDVGGYKFGTSFAFLFGGGVRWVPGGRFALRFDVTDHLYEIDYPDAYLLPLNGNVAVVSGTGRGSWQHNAAITLGASYQFFR